MSPALLSSSPRFRPITPCDASWSNCSTPPKFSLRRAKPRQKPIKVRDRLRGPLNRVFEPASLFLQLAAHAAVQAGMQAIAALFGFGCDGARRVTKRRDSLVNFAVEPLLNLRPQSLHGLRCCFCRATLQLCKRTFRKSFD